METYFIYQRRKSRLKSVTGVGVIIWKVCSCCTIFFTRVFGPMDVSHSTCT